MIRVVPLLKDGTPRWLAIAADIHERKQAEQERERLLAQLEHERGELAVQYAVVRVLAESLSLADAAPRLLATFCEQLGWQAAALWALVADDVPSRALSLLHVRQQPDLTPRTLLKRSLPPPVEKGRHLAGRVWAGKKPLFLPRLSATRGPAHHRAAARLGLRAAFAFPILLNGEVQGVVELFTGAEIEPSQRLIDIVSAVGIQIGQFLQRTRALELLRQSEEALIQVNNALELRVRERTVELRDANRELSAEIAERARLEREIISISEREQRRIGQDLHDGLCQELTAIAFMTRALYTRMHNDGSLDTAGRIEADRINQVSSLINESVTRCRDIARGLHPVEMEADGLMVALRDLARRTHQTIACSFVCKEPILMPESDMALNLYRIAQEAVNNAIKYARATRITITLDRDRKNLRLSIRDNGRGIPGLSTRLRRKRTGMGLHIMRYRARTMGSTLDIIDLKPHGTEVSCLLPRVPPAT
jgi:signal transduction histidine kinase